jgi:hypothetical protein
LEVALCRYVHKFQEMGIDVDINEVLPASYMAAAYLSTFSHPAKGGTDSTARGITHAEDVQRRGGRSGVTGKVLAFGTRGLCDELELAVCCLLS